MKCGRVIVQACSLLAVTAAGGGGDSSTSTSSISSAHQAEKDGLSTIAIASLLVGLGIFVERFKESLLHGTPENLKPVVVSLLSELTLLGFISVILYLIESLGMLEALSERLFNDSRHLLHLFHSMHMMLFFVMILFLCQVMILVATAYKVGKTWRHYETIAQDQHFLAKQATRMGTLGISRVVLQHILKSFVCLFCFSLGVVDHEVFTYACIRERFVKGDTADEDQEDEEQLKLAKLVKERRSSMSPQSPGSGNKVFRRLEIWLDEDSSAPYRKRRTVHAFRLDAPARISKSWGMSEGKAGDWILCANDDCYICGTDEFNESYEAVNRRPHEYRKKKPVYAIKLNQPFNAITKKNGQVTRQKGAPGSYLVQPDIALSINDLDVVQPIHKDQRQISADDNVPDGLTQYVVNPTDFDDLYEHVREGEISEKGGLQPDFDFAMYLNLRLGHTLAKIVEVKITTWFLVELALIIMFALYVLLNNAVTKFAVAMIFSGYSLPILAVLIERKLKSVRTQLTSRELYHVLENVSTEQANAPQAKQLNSPQAKKWSESKASMKIAPAPPDSSELKTILGQDTHRTGSSPATTGTDGGGSGEPVIDELSIEDGGNEAQPITEQPKKYSPPYLRNTTAKKRSPCLRKWLGRPANKHEVLFWYDQYGPHFIIVLVQSLMLISGCYIAVSATLLSNACSSYIPSVNATYEEIQYVLAHQYITNKNACIGLGLLCAGPVLVVVCVLPFIVKDLVIVTGIEKMKDVRTIEEVIRLQNVNRSIRALRLLSAMTIYTKSESRKQTSEGRKQTKEPSSVPDQTATQVYGKKGSARYTKRRRELFEAFSLFDRENQGYITAANMQELMEFLGMSTRIEGDMESRKTSVVVQTMVAEIDRSGNGRIEFQEFFDWVAAHERPAKNKATELSTLIFHTIDHDNNKKITSSELRNALASLGGGVLTHDDVMHLVREADANHDGVIDLHEFANMMDKSMQQSEFGLG